MSYLNQINLELQDSVEDNLCFKDDEERLSESLEQNEEEEDIDEEDDIILEVSYEEVIQAIERIDNAVYDTEVVNSESLP